MKEMNKSMLRFKEKREKKKKKLPFIKKAGNIYLHPIQIKL